MGEGWGEGIKKADALIILPPHPRLLPQGEGAGAFYNTLLREKEQGTQIRQNTLAFQGLNTLIKIHNHSGGGTPDIAILILNDVKAQVHVAHPVDGRSVVVCIE